MLRMYVYMLSLDVELHAVKELLFLLGDLPFRLAAKPPVMPPRRRTQKKEEQ